MAHRPLPIDNPHLSQGMRLRPPTERRVSHTKGTRCTHDRGCAGSSASMLYTLPGNKPRDIICLSRRLCGYADSSADNSIPPHSYALDPYVSRSTPHSTFHTLRFPHPPHNTPSLPRTLAVARGDGAPYASSWAPGSPHVATPSCRIPKILTPNP